jgi:antitoxin Phd
MRKWQVQDAKARFSELLDASLKEGPQIVTKCRVDTAVVVPFEQWQRLQQAKPMTLREWLLSDVGRGDIPLPSRSRMQLRKPPNLD